MPIANHSERAPQRGVFEAQARDHAFQEIQSSGPRSSERLEIEDLKDVRLTITVDLGRKTMLVREILELKRGSIFQLSKLAGEMCDIYLGELPFAKGEVVVIGDAQHVRIGELLGAEEKREGIGQEQSGEDEE